MPIVRKTRLVCWTLHKWSHAETQGGFWLLLGDVISIFKEIHVICRENQGCLLNAAQAVICGDIGQRLTSAQGFHIYMFKEMTSSSFSSKWILSVLDFINNTMLSYIIQTFCFLSGNKCLAQSCTFNTLLVQASLFTVFAFKKFRRNCSRPVLVALLGKLWLPLALSGELVILKLQQFIGDVLPICGK